MGKEEGRGAWGAWKQNESPLLLKGVSLLSNGDQSPLHSEGIYIFGNGKESPFHSEGIELHANSNESPPGSTGTQIFLHGKESLFWWEWVSSSWENHALFLLMGKCHNSILKECNYLQLEWASHYFLMGMNHHSSFWKESQNFLMGMSHHSTLKESNYFLMGTQRFLMGVGRLLIGMSHRSSLLEANYFPMGMNHILMGQSHIQILTNGKMPPPQSKGWSLIIILNGQESELFSDGNESPLR